MKNLIAITLLVVASLGFTACTTTTTETDATATADSLAAALLQATTPVAGPVETKLANDQIPQAIKDYLGSTFAEYEMGEAEKIEDAGVITYELEILVNGLEKELIFDADGKFVKEEAGEADHGHDHGDGEAHDHSH